MDLVKFFQKEKNRTVYLVLRHVSKSGMLREISCFVCKDNSILDVTSKVSDILGIKIGKHYGIKMTGCGMDIGFYLVYLLGNKIWPNGDGKTITNRNGPTEVETNGGYLLRHIWL